MKYTDNIVAFYQISIYSSSVMKISIQIGSVREDKIPLMLYILIFRIEEAMVPQFLRTKTFRKFFIHMMILQLFFENIYKILTI